MPKLYLVNALRNIAAQKLYSAINILGLAVGLAACLMISLFVRYEMTYDKFFAEADNIYRLSSDYPATAEGPERRLAGSGGPLAPLIQESRHEDIREVARTMFVLTMVVGDEFVAQERVFYTDSSFFRIFDFDWLQGSADTVFTRPDSIVITASLAERYFGDRNPYGQTLTLDDRNPMIVRGVIADIPENSHLTNGMFVPMEHLRKQIAFLSETNWRVPFHTYLLLDPKADIARVAEDISGMVAATFAADGGLGTAPQFTPYALKDIHMGSTHTGELKEAGNPLVMAAYSAIAAALLLIACINYINLATARTSWRAREIGIRKTAGARRRDLFGQFFGEASLIVGVALALAVTLVEVLLPVFGSIIGRQLVFAELAEPDFMLFTAAIALLTVLGAGGYPALWLSGFKPVVALRGQHGAGQNGTGQSGVAVRNVLVVLQFTLAIALVTVTLVIYLQMNFVRGMDLGFDKEQVLTLRGSNQEGLGTQWPVLKRELLNHPDVVSVTEGTLFPRSSGTQRIRVEGGTADNVGVDSIQGGFDFLQTYAIPLIAGRYFDEQLISDTRPMPGYSPEPLRSGSYILSESAARALGLSPEEAIGRRVELDLSRDFTNTSPGTIVGVVGDIHPHSLHEASPPNLFYVPESSPGSLSRTIPAPTSGLLAIFNQASVRLSGRNTAETLAWIRQRWAQFLPDIPLMYEFLDTRYAALYQNEERQAGLFTFFAALTTSIASLGLFGLTAFTVEKRFREIGIRKVLGSSVWQIVLLLTNDFSKLVLLSNLIAWPVAYFAMNRWLENFAYRIDLTPMIFIGSGLIALCIAWVTVGGTAAKAASAKPVLALRYE